jgi:NADH dehydrogenase [ubiquinone] 1 alpha subcomplex assembly factor 3
VFDFDLPKDFSSIEPPMQIWAMGEGMFSVNNIWIPGPIIIFPTAVFMWNAPRLEDLEDHHLDILKLIQPRLDYAVLGTGRGKVLNFAEGVRKRFRGIGINLDLCPTVIFT